MNHALRWLERLFDPEVGGVGAGEGTLRTLETRWIFAPWVTLVMAALVVAFVLYCYLNERTSASRNLRLGLSAIRIALVGIVCLMLAQVWMSRERTGLSYVVVVIDDSASMGTTDVYDDQKLRALVDRQLKAVALDAPTRLNLAKSVLLDHDAEMLRMIDNQYKLKVYFLSETERPQSGDWNALAGSINHLEATGKASRLGKGLRGILNDLRGTPPAAVLLFSDGITTEGETLTDVATYARRKGVPLFTVGLGSDDPIRDLEVEDLLVDEVVFVDDVVNFEFNFTTHGVQGRRVTIHLREKGGSTTLASLDVTAGPDGKPQRVRLPYRPTKVGDFEYEIEAAPLPNEVQLDNNRKHRLVSVRKEQVRTLLVQSYPNYEYRYLKQMLQRDSTVALKTVLQEADVQYPEIDEVTLPVFPVRREELFAYDVIIFGDVNPSFLSPSVMENLAAFVTEKGGGIVMIAGPLFTPEGYRDTALAPLVPIEAAGAAAPDLNASLSQEYQVAPTELGLAMPFMQLGNTPEETAQIWRRLPPLFWMYEAPNVKPAARVLAERSGSDGRRLPVIVMQYVGAGKVLFHGMDETWRWRKQVGDVFFARYWIQSLRYLSRTKLLGKDRSAVLTADRRKYERGESVQLRVRFFDERLAPADDNGVTVVVEQQGHPERRMQLARQPSNRATFEGVLSKPSEGTYHAWIAVPAFGTGAPATDFSVVLPAGEGERVQMDAAELKRAAAETKGQYYTLATVGNLLQDLPQGQQVPIETLPPLVLWNRWPVLLAFVSLIITEWLLRKRKGML